MVEKIRLPSRPVQKGYGRAPVGEDGTAKGDEPEHTSQFPYLHQLKKTNPEEGR